MTIPGAANPVSTTTADDLVRSGAASTHAEDLDASRKGNQQRDAQRADSSDNQQRADIPTTERRLAPYRIADGTARPIAPEPKELIMDASTKDADFCLSRAEGATFEPMTGYRDWLKIRDLGLSDATNGQFDAWITRANRLGGATGRHHHEYDFQIMYVLRGWVKMYYEGQGEHILRAGDFVHHPPGIVHDFMDYSEDIEIFEMAGPAGHYAIDTI